jgi:hypothetical protein
MIWLLPIIFLLNFKAEPPVKQQVAATLQPYILKEAAWALTQQPITVTSQSCPRSAGGKHDFYSEGDYWWPNPANPADPTYRRMASPIRKFLRRTGWLWYALAK